MYKTAREQVDVYLRAMSVRRLLIGDVVKYFIYQMTTVATNEFIVVITPLIAAMHLQKRGGNKLSSLGVSLQ